MITRITTTKEYKPIVDHLLSCYCTYNKIADIMLKQYRVSIGLEGYNKELEKWVKLI